MSAVLEAGPRARRRRPALDPQARATVLWIGSLWLLTLILQRFTIPGLPITILIPVAFVWALWGLYRGIAEIDARRLSLWALAFGSAAVLIFVQDLVLPDPALSVTSLLLFATVWAPVVLRLVDRRMQTYLATLRVVAGLSAVLAVAATAMMVSQLLGVRFVDWFEDAVPPLLQYPSGFFIITYPIEYGSEIYRANAWIGLEPSFVSAQLGLGIVAGLLARIRPLVLIILFAGMLSTVAGSGFLILVVAGVVMLFSRMRSALLRYGWLVPVALVAILTTDLGQNMLARLTEGGQSRSSTSLRTLLPYTRFWPEWTDGLPGVLFGRGPGTTEDLLPTFGIDGLIVSTPIKVFFEYGLIVGTLIAALMILTMFRGPSRAIAFSLVFSLWTLQPGTTNFLIVAPAFLLVTLWSPRMGMPIEQFVNLPDDSPTLPEPSKGLSRL